MILITHDDKVAAQARRIGRISDGEIVEDSVQPGRQGSLAVAREGSTESPNPVGKAGFPSHISLDRVGTDSQASSASWLQDMGTL
ncbi:hypothetical protein ACMV56_27410, partial [Klebsiella pneumoniae]